MGIIKAIGFCRCCGEDVLVLRRLPMHALHLLLTCLTAGLWAPAWWFAAHRGRVWYCSQCGRMVVNGAITPLPAPVWPAVPHTGQRALASPPTAFGHFNQKLVFQGLVYYMPTGTLMH